MCSRIALVELGFSSVAIRAKLAAAPGMMAALILAAWYTGCRIGELVRAKHSHIDHARKQLTAQCTGLEPSRSDPRCSAAPSDRLLASLHRAMVSRLDGSRPKHLWLFEPFGADFFRLNFTT